MLVYFIVFGAGTFYIFRLMMKAPHGDDGELAQSPTRTAGITPAQQLEAAGGGHGH